MTVRDWSVDDARRLRRRDGSRRARWHALFGQHVQGALQTGLGAAAKVMGESVFRPALHRAARRMNAHQATAYQGYLPRDSDIICSAYFKAGTNWVMHICYQIAHLGEGRFDHIQDEIAWPDAAEPRYWRALSDDNSKASRTGYRVIKSHLPAGLVPIDSAARIIAVTRDPVDCAASGYHFFAKLFFGPMTPPPDVWLDYFGSDDAICGPWHHFTASWWAERHRENVLFLRFEDMKVQPVETISRIAEFLDIALTPEQSQRIADATSFAAMKKLNDKFYPVRQTIWSSPEGQIIRKGSIGDGSNLFSPGVLEDFRTKMAVGLAQAGCRLPFYGFSQGKTGDRT